MKTTSWAQAVWQKKWPVAAIVALVLVGGSFAFASGELGGGTALMADVYAAFSGNPILVLGRDGASPARPVMADGALHPLAIFDVSTGHVTHWTTIKNLTGEVAIVESAPAPLNFAQLTLTYNYCIPATRTYGYGWPGGVCGTMNVPTSSVVKNGNEFDLTFNTSLPIYPTASYSALTVNGAPYYGYTASSTKAGAADAQLRVVVESLSASGDQCARDGTSCVALPANVYIQLGSGRTLTATRPYGYGYAGLHP